MSDALRYATLGLAAIAGKREQVQGQLAEVEAQRAASAQQFEQDKRLKILESDLQYQRESKLKEFDSVLEARKSNLRHHLIQLPNGNVDVVSTYGPVMDETVFPAGAIQLGMATGDKAGTKDNPYVNANSSGLLDDIPLPLHNVDGVVGTAEEHRRIYGVGVDLRLGNQVGTRTRKNGDVYFKDEDRRSIFGSRHTTTYEVMGVDGVVRTTNPTLANNTRTQTGNDIIIIDQEVDNNNNPIGSPTRSKYDGQVSLGERGITEETYDVYLKTPKGVNVVSGLSETEYLRTLQENNITDPKSVYTEVNNVKRDRFTNEIISQTQSRTIVPKDVEYKKTTYNILLPSGSMIKSVDAEDVDRHLKSFNLSRSDVHLYAFDTKYLNGEVVEYMVNESLSSAPSGKVAVGYVAGQDGEPMLVTAGQSETEWNERYGKYFGAEFAGIRTIKDGKIVEESLVDPEETRMISGMGADGERFEVLIDDATPDQEARATQSVPVKVSPSGKVVTTGDAKDTSRQALVSKQNVPFTISGDLFDGSRLLGASQDLQPESQLTRMNSTLLETGILQSLVDSGRAEDYVNTFAPLIYNTIDQMRKDQKQKEGTDLLGGKTVASFVNDLYDGFKQVPGLIRKLRSIETLNFADEANIAMAAAQDTALPGELTVTALTSTNADELDTDNRSPNPSANGNQVRALSCNVPAGNADFCENVFIPKLESLHGPGNPTDIKIIDMMEKQYDMDGEPIVDENGKVELVEAQPIMTVFEEFSKVTVDENTGETYFDKLEQAANGATLNDSDFRYLAKVVDVAPSVNSAVLHIAPLIKGVSRNGFNEVTFIPPSLQAVARRNSIDRFSTTQGEQQYFATIAKQDSAIKVKKYSNALIKSLVKSVNPDGSVNYYSSTGVGELEMTVDGLFYLGNEAVNRIKGFISGNQFTEIGDLVKGQLGTYKDRLLEQQRAAGSVDAKRIEDDTDGQKEINQIIDDILNEAGEARSEADRLIAVRQLYIVSLAYELSATMQGGTGGRTISDQDVAIILKALRTKFTASPQQQHAVLEEIGRIADDIYTHTRYRTMRSTDPKQMAEVAAYYFTVGLSAVYGDTRGFHRSIDTNTVRDRIMSTGPLARIPDKDILESINIQRRIDNKKPYENYESIPTKEANDARAAFSGS